MLLRAVLGALKDMTKMRQRRVKTGDLLIDESQIEELNPVLPSREIYKSGCIYFLSLKIFEIFNSKANHVSDEHGSKGSDGEAREKLLSNILKLLSLMRSARKKETTALKFLDLRFMSLLLCPASRPWLRKELVLYQGKSNV